MKNIHNMLGTEKANGLLGFYVFAGADTSGRIAGKTKKNVRPNFQSSFIRRIKSI